MAVLDSHQRLVHQYNAYWLKVPASPQKINLRAGRYCQYWAILPRPVIAG